MLDRTQVDAAADALLSPAREVQQALQRQDTVRRQARVARQRIVLVGLVGMALGCVVGGVVFGNAMPAGIVGLGIGFLVGRIVTRRPV